MAVEVPVLANDEGQPVSARPRPSGDMPWLVNVFFHVTWIGLVLLMYQCTDALPVSPTAHHVLEFFLEALG